VPHKLLWLSPVSQFHGMPSLIDMCPCYRCHHPMASLVGKRSVPRPSLRPPLNGGCLLFCSHQGRESMSSGQNEPFRNTRGF
jgi:hypothetical protein